MEQLAFIPVIAASAAFIAVMVELFIKLRKTYKTKHGVHQKVMSSDQPKALAHASIYD